MKKNERKMHDLIASLKRGDEVDITLRCLVISTAVDEIIDDNLPKFPLTDMEVYSHFAEKLIYVDVSDFDRDDNELINIKKVIK